MSESQAPQANQSYICFMYLSDHKKQNTEGPFCIVVIAVDRLQKNRLYDTSKKDEYASLNYALGVSFIIMHSESLRATGHQPRAT